MECMLHAGGKRGVMAVIGLCRAGCIALHCKLSLSVMRCRVRWVRNWEWLYALRESALMLFT